MKPKARESHLLQQEAGSELIVYDRERHCAHRLNRTAALIWRHCDGRTSVPQLAEILHHQLHLPANEDLVSLGLERLRQAHLLEDGSVAPDAISRREAMRRVRAVGIAALLAPVVASMTAPTPAMADSAGGQVRCNVGRKPPCAGSCAFINNTLRCAVANPGSQNEICDCI